MDRDEADADTLLCYLCDTVATTPAGLLAQVETLGEVMGADRLPDGDATRRLIERIAAGLRSLT